MSIEWNMQLILAQADAPPAGPTGGATGDGTATTSQAPPLPEDPVGGPNGGAQPTGAPGGGNFLWIMVLMLVIFWVVMMIPQRREKKRRAEMLGNLAKGDKVQTIGGVLGSVVEVREHEVILKVDESNNTRMRFARAAIQTVLADGKAANGQ